MPRQRSVIASITTLLASAAEHVHQLDLPTQDACLLCHVALMLMIGIGIFAAPRAVLDLATSQLALADGAMYL
ncbi:MAG TPA: hypothetical protein VFY97_09430 [Rhodanobacteraceae bacterium]|nr:hypothetical protein [Rhodanobacteraceae bacterium]